MEKYFHAITTGGVSKLGNKITWFLGKTNQMKRKCCCVKSTVTCSWIFWKEFDGRKKEEFNRQSITDLTTGIRHLHLHFENFSSHKFNSLRSGQFQFGEMANEQWREKAKRLSMEIHSVTSAEFDDFAS